MIDAVGVRFKRTGKVYYFDPDANDISIGDHVVVNTARGLELGYVTEFKQMDAEELSTELRNVVRVATDEDLLVDIDNKNMATEAIIRCEQLCKQHKLDMQLVSCEYTFDRSKLLFYFTSGGRVDFRELVKDLAQEFKTRIELRQIGVRDHAKMVGGLGCCGRSTCCSSFLTEFSPVSIKMAKDQDLSLNPQKISGLCGRLMCCLKYEQDGYECILKRMPKEGEIVKTGRGPATVVSTFTIQELVKVRFQVNDEVRFEYLSLDEIERTGRFDKKFKMPEEVEVGGLS